MESSDAAQAKGECPTCSKLVSKSNIPKHHKVCGKKKPPKSRKAINRDSYARNKVKVLQKRQEKRMFDQFRRLEVARKQLAELEAQQVEEEELECTAWTAFSKRNLLYGVSLDPELSPHFLEELKACCKAKYNHGPIMTTPKEVYRAAIFVLHPDKLRRQKNRFGARIEEVMAHWDKIAFNAFGDGLKADIDMKPQADLDAMTDVEYSDERRRVALARKAKAQTEKSDFETLTANF
ncbi:hypothetical protein P3T76_010032 [Phytophthora citrophthora]|uniref:Uncharacterized protein n=1 Tax=Phytophthora citrophthora TaxID=4793 RepID=A0AAD9GDZ2_9STRA|nr:hypothetical protein P3T76_010032 [Phytophthora citrophthora]